MSNKRFPEEFKIETVKQITYIRTHEGWLYLSVVLDLFTRQVTGWSIRQRIDRGLLRQRHGRELRPVTQA